MVIYLPDDKVQSSLGHCGAFFKNCIARLSHRDPCASSAMLAASFNLLRLPALLKDTCVFCRMTEKPFFMYFSLLRFFPRLI